MVFRIGSMGRRFGDIQGVSDRRLSEKSLLRFMYPTNGATSLGREGIVLTLPFFENPIIQESQRPRWTKHDLLGRNGQMFTFTGAQSRRIKLTFNLTVPHIKADNKHPVIRYIQGPDPKSATRDSMRNSGAPSKSGGKSKTYGGTINLVTWWVNVIRSSTVNNGRDPTLGPPVIMLKHGTLYQDTKFICESYGISFDEEAGYEHGTHSSSPHQFINRRIIVSMELAEIKIGDDYEPWKAERGDSVTGWHDLMEWGIMDPRNDAEIIKQEDLGTEKSSWNWTAKDVPVPVRPV